MDILHPEFRERLKRLRFAAERVASGRAPGHRLSKAVGQGLEFVGHRAYSPGDDIRYIDWNAYSRLEQFVVKQFEAPGELTLVLALDCAPTMDYGNPNKFRHLRELTAALGYIALHSADRVMLAPLARGAIEMPICSGPASEISFLQSLKRIKPASTLKNPAKWLSRIRKVRGDSTVIILTDFQNQKPLLQLLRELRRMHAKVLVVQTIAPQEFNPDLDGRCRLSLIGEEGGKRVKLEVTPQVQADYRRELENFRHAVSHACRRASVSHFEVGSLEPVESLVLEFVAAGIVRVGAA